MKKKYDIPFEATDPRYHKVYHLMRNKGLSKEEAVKTIEQPDTKKKITKKEPPAEKPSTKSVTQDPIPLSIPSYYSGAEENRLVTAIELLESRIESLQKCIEQHNAPKTEPDGDPLGIMVMILDVTFLIHKNLHQDLQRIEKLLKR